MVSFHIPETKKVRVILNTDAKNEVDDQFAIVQAVLTEAFDLRGLIAAHFGTEKSAHSEKDSYKEIEKVLTYINQQDKVNIYHGSENAMSDETSPMDSEGARFIIEEAMKEDSRPLYIAFLGPLTDMASAILLEPGILDRNIVVVWIGGGVWPNGGREYNLQNDISAANVVFRSSLELWQIPRNVYRMMPVSLAELYARVKPCGTIGEYLYHNVVDFNNAGLERPVEYRILGDSPAVGVILYHDCGEWDWKPAPVFDENMYYIHTGENRPIKVYRNIDSRFILEDLYAKLFLSAQNDADRCQKGDEK